MTLRLQEAVEAAVRDRGLSSIVIIPRGDAGFEARTQFTVESRNAPGWAIRGTLEAAGLAALGDFGAAPEDLPTEDLGVFG